MSADRFDDYKARWRNLHLERESGVLLMRLHSDGESLLWGARAGSVHDQLGRAWRAINRDRDNRVLILTAAARPVAATSSR